MFTDFLRENSSTFFATSISESYSSSTAALSIIGMSFSSSTVIAPGGIDIYESSGFTSGSSISYTSLVFSSLGSITGVFSSTTFSSTFIRGAFSYYSFGNLDAFNSSISALAAFSLLIDSLLYLMACLMCLGKGAALMFA